MTEPIDELIAKMELTKNGSLLREMYVDEINRLFDELNALKVSNK